MKKTCILSVLLLVVITSKNIKAQTMDAQPSQVVIGSIVSVYSEVLNEKREILIYVPASASNEVYTKEQYPVIYLLDGDDAHFAAVVGMMRPLSDNFDCPEMIVVGIQNTDRNRDLIPIENDIVGNSGGAESFLSFIETEIIPYIDSNYPTLPFRIIAGHSLGGLLVMHALVNHPNIFNTYIAIEPSIILANQKLLERTNEVMSSSDFSGKSLFLGIAHPLGEGMDTMKVENDATGLFAHVHAMHAVKDLLLTNQQNNLNFGYRIYENYSHNTVRIITELDGIRFFFNYFSLYGSDNSKLGNTIQTIYEKYSKQIGITIKPPERLIDFGAYASMQQRLFDTAFDLLNLNVSNYPESYNVYNSLGDYYTAIGDMENAMNSYKKSLSIKEVEIVRKKLEDIQVGQGNPK